MASHSSKSDKSIGRLRYGVTVALSSTIVVGCGAPADPPTRAAQSSAPDHSQPVQYLAQSAAYCPNTVMCTTNQAAITSSTSTTQKILTDVHDLLTAGSGYFQNDPAGIANGILQLVTDNFFSPSSPNLEGEINCLSQQTQCLAQGLDWKVTDIAWEDDQYVPVTAALMDMQTGFTAGPGDDDNSHIGTEASGGIDMFSRLYVPSATDGDGKWKNIVYNSAPDTTGNGQVFDWQAGFTRFTTLIPRRLAIIAYLDPNFQRDGSRNEELDGTEGYRPTLQAWLKKMKAGVHCFEKDRDNVGDWLYEKLGRYSYTDIACADVNSGISAETVYRIPDFRTCDLCSGNTCVTDYNCLQNLGSYWQVTVQSIAMAHQVQAQLPIFEVQSMIDSLYRITHPGPDLTDVLGRIPVTSDHSLCLDVEGANSTSGTPVWIWGCNGTVAQQWSYNRKAGTITNTAFGKCLQVRLATDGTEDRDAGSVAEISDCLSPVPLRQQWTYDPEKGLIRSALGNALQYEKVQQGTPVLLQAPAEYSTETHPSQQSWYADASIKGDGNGDGLADIRLTGVGSNIPIAENQGGGEFYCDSWPVDVADFTNVWSTSPNVKALAGDFDGNGRADVALTGVAGWSTIPVAFATTSSTFRVTNIAADETAFTQFGSWAASQNVWPVTGDFNGDGRTDIALTGGADWWTIPVAFSKGDGSFHVTDQSVDATFNSNAIQPGARPVTGDFNGDGLSDIALIGGTQANQIVVALSNGDGNFTIKVESVTSGDTNFAYYATLPGVQVLSGDFNGDGKGDIALTGGEGWWTIPVAFSNNGTFSVANADISSGDGNFPYYAAVGGVMAVSGDFNKDGKADIALTGGVGWWTIPVAFSNGDGTFSPTNNASQGLDFPSEATTPGVSATGGGY